MNHSTPPILLLPSEIKHLIVTELSSPDSLAALARTHTSFQKYAEQALYHTIAIQIHENVPLTCLETLAANSEKATLVRSLKIERSGSSMGIYWRATTCFAKALVNMHFLTDLRIRIYPMAKELIKDLHNALCKGHFQLKTLYCNGMFNIPRIIKSQTELQILGIYARGAGVGYLLPTLKRFRDAQLSVPTIFGLTRESSNLISICPALYSLDRTTLLAKSLSKYSGVDQFHTLSVSSINSSDMSTIHALAKGLAGCFPQIRCLLFNFEHLCEIPSHETKEVLSLFSNLLQVGFYFVNGSGEDELYGDIPEEVDAVVAHAKIWGAACSKLTEVKVFGVLVKKQEEDGWTEIEDYW